MLGAVAGMCQDHACPGCWDDQRLQGHMASTRLGGPFQLPLPHTSHSQRGRCNWASPVSRL